jgi:hypothetical protein
MLPDSMVRLIESATVPEFRALSLLYLDAAGYADVELKDGPYDGGQDVGLFRQGGNPEPVVVQLSTQRKNWEGKVRTDAIKAKGNFVFGLFIYLTSRRIPAEKAEQVIDSLSSNDQIFCRIVDAQAIASKLYTERRTPAMLDALGLDDAASADGGFGRPRNLREDLAYAYAFFGTDTENFREAVLDRSIAGYITRSGGHAARDTIVRVVGQALNMKGRDHPVASRVDRLLQKGDLNSEAEGIGVAPRLVEAHKAARKVRGRQWRILQDDVRGVLGSAGLTGSGLESAATAVSETAGAMLMAAGDSAGAGLTPGMDAGPAKGQIRAQLSRLERDLAHGGMEQGQTTEMITKLTEVISESEIGQTLLAGHLYVSIAGMEPSSLMRAFGGHERLEIVLDASVAIPMLAGLMYEPHEARDFRSAHYAYEKAKKYGADLILPSDYLEEAASHLLNAFDKYRPLMEANVDLRFSNNAFVAHYETLKHLGKCTETFEQYGAKFGLRLTTGSERDFIVERDWIMARMETLFRQYEIQLSGSNPIPKSAMRAAQDAVSFTAEQLELERPRHLLDHDARAIAETMARASGDNAVLFCSWDRLHLQLQTSGGFVEWNAVDPAMLGDLFALVSDDDANPIGGAVEVALEMGDDEARRGAQIWDQLISIEKDSIFDAELIGRAKGFIDGYLDRGRTESREKIGKAWEEWKQESGS